MKRYERERPGRVSLARDERVLSALTGAAFGPPCATPGPVADPARFEELADGLSLTPRVAARLGRSGVEALAGRDVAERFRRRQMRVAAGNVASLALLRHVAGIGASSGVGLVVLKHGALLLEGVVAEGGREACDLDVLVSEGEAEALYDLLVKGGFLPSPMGPCDHQLAGLHHPRFGTVEIHTHLPGLRMGPKDSFARLEDLAARDVLRSVDVEGVEVRLLSRPLLAAHLVAHGLAQHGDRPDTYPILRMFGDLIDLGAFRDGGARLLEEAGPWVATDVSRRRLDAMQALGRALEEGVAVRQLPANARRLLGHVVLGTLDPDYVAMMRLALFRRPLSDSPAPSRVAAVCRTLFPARGSSALAKTADPPGWTRLLRNRALRPFALGGRLAASVLAAGRVALRGAWQVPG
ncbi:MAG: nucleotidyltransferase family protein [Thermoanaerobaculia bacterium]|nr:nucleotidyltransferase family protein [Thermoanaerobaculia bacterium]